MLIQCRKGDTFVIRSVRTVDLFECRRNYLQPVIADSVYPWEIIPKIGNYIRQICEGGLEGFTRISETVYIGEGVSIASTAVIEGWAVIGGRSTIRPGAYLRGNVITGEGCVIGNSTELKNCMLMDGVQLPHYNYVGDSVLGNGAHMGAGAICSNLKQDGKNVVIRGDISYETGMRKLGAILGDQADIGCGCVLNPGTIIGKGTSVYPLNSLRGVLPSGCIVKSTNDIVERIKNFQLT